jgi:hypothetical protein
MLAEIEMGPRHLGGDDVTKPYEVFSIVLRTPSGPDAMAALRASLTTPPSAASPPRGGLGWFSHAQNRNLRASFCLLFSTPSSEAKRQL